MPRNSTTDYEEAKENIITGIKSCIQYWCNWHASFSEWRQALTSQFMKKLAIFQPN